MDLNSATQLIIEYRYVILVPLAILEGPVVAFVAGTLASLGYFNVYALGAFFLIRDLVMDGLYYALGYFGGNTGIVRRLLGKIGVRQDHLDGVHDLWANHAGTTMFVGKLSYGVASTFVVLAGTVKMPLSKFFKWGAVVAALQYWTLLALGYYFGASLAPSSTHLIETIQYVIAGVALIASAYYVMSLYMRGRLLKKTKVDDIEK